MYFYFRNLDLIVKLSVYVRLLEKINFSRRKYHDQIWWKTEINNDWWQEGFSSECGKIYDLQHSISKPQISSTKDKLILKCFLTMYCSYKHASNRQKIYFKPIYLVFTTSGVFKDGKTRVWASQTGRQSSRSSVRK